MRGPETQGRSNGGRSNRAQHRPPPMFAAETSFFTADPFAGSGLPREWGVPPCAPRSPGRFLLPRLTLAAPDAVPPGGFAPWRRFAAEWSWGRWIGIGPWNCLHHGCPAATEPLAKTDLPGVPPQTTNPVPDHGEDRPPPPRPIESRVGDVFSLLAGSHDGSAVNNAWFPAKLAEVSTARNDAVGCSRSGRGGRLLP